MSFSVLCVLTVPQKRQNSEEQNINKKVAFIKKNSVLKSFILQPFHKKNSSCYVNCQLDRFLNKHSYVLLSHKLLILFQKE